MSQYDWGTIDPYTKTGTALATDLNAYRTAVNSLHKGTANPTYLAAGMQWIKDTTIPWEHYYWDGAQNIRIGTIDATNNWYNITSDSRIFLPTTDAAMWYLGDMWFDTTNWILNVKGTSPPLERFHTRSYDTIGKNWIDTVTSINWASMSAYRWLRFEYALSTPTGATMALRTSIDNGTTYAATAADYMSIIESVAEGTPTTIGKADGLAATAGDFGTYVIGAAGPSYYFGQVDIFNFNQARPMEYLAMGLSFDSGGTPAMRFHRAAGRRVLATARDAIRFCAVGASGTLQAMTGWYTLGGSRI